MVVINGILATSGDCDELAKRIEQNKISVLFCKSGTTYTNIITD